MNEQVDALWEDLIEAYEAEAGTQDNKETPPCFLGSILLAKDSNGSYYNVIDGQQRLTTLTILLCVIRDLFPNINSKDGNPDPTNVDKNTILNSISQNDGQYGRLKLHTHDQHQNDFEKLILKKEATTKHQKIYKYYIKKDEEPKYKFINTTNLFVEKLKELGEEQAGKFLNYIFNHVYIIRIDCSSLSTAVRIFQVLNARGLDLTDSDLIKSFFIWSY